MTTPGGNFPPDAITGSDLSSLDGLNEASWRAGLNAEVIGAPGGSTGFNGLASIFGGINTNMTSMGSDIQDLQSTTNDLSLATGHATAYMPTGPGTTTTPTRMPFTAQSGTLRGVTNLGNGQWRLDSAGEWDLSAQVEFWGGVLMPPETYLEIIILYPTGSGIFDGVQAKASASSNITVTNVTSTQVPAPGYRVEVRAWTGKLPLVGGTFRGISGGYSTTRLRIRKFEMMED